ncbi:glycosyltransferase [Galactobacter valiniphilus]|uniref:glycosyltransferase n=1 Tax=Galactobacter valiniphilus TaxID=2676122 RepID=UPI003736C0FD
MNAARIVVSLGTDVHPFERLLAWAEGFADHHPEVSVLVQHGSSRAPIGRARGVVATDRDTLLSWYRAADVVITQGGPGSILDAREAGMIPLVVPRDPALGEHVDGHQQAFVPVMVGAGHAVLVTDLTQLRALVAERLAHPERFVAQERHSDAASAAAALGELVSAALDAPPQRGRLGRRVRGLLRRGPRGSTDSTLPSHQGTP